MSKNKLVEFETAEDIKQIVYLAVQQIKEVQAKGSLEAGHIVALEKLAKVYTIMMADLRESMKQGLGGMSTEDLEHSAGLEDDFPTLRSEDGNELVNANDESDDET